jgi:hypothetical protein
MLPEEYKIVVQDLINATSQGKVVWSRGSSPDTFVAEPNNKTKVLIDAYYSQAAQTTASCINITLFEKASGKLIDEIVICDQDNQPQDYELLKQLYLTARKQFADKGINPLLTEISASIK